MGALLSRIRGLVDSLGGSLEALIRTGSPNLCYLYHTIEKGGVRTRKGDKHDAASLLKEDKLILLEDLDPSKMVLAVEKEASSKE